MYSQFLVVYILAIKSLGLGGVPSSYFDNIDGVSSRTVNMNDQKERKIIFNQFNLTQEEFDRARHNMAYNIKPASATTPETWAAEKGDALKKVLR